MFRYKVNVQMYTGAFVFDPVSYYCFSRAIMFCMNFYYFFVSFMGIYRKPVINQ